MPMGERKYDYVRVPDKIYFDIYLYADISSFSVSNSSFLQLSYVGINFRNRVFFRFLLFDFFEYV